MKKIIITLLSIAVVSAARSQMAISHSAPAANVLNNTDFTPPPQATVLDPVRALNGRVVHVDGSWLAFSGRVIEVTSTNLVHVQGTVEGQAETTDFVVAHLPYAIGEGDTVPPQGYVYLVKPAGLYVYLAKSGSRRTIHMYDYGIPYTPPLPTPAELAARAAQKKVAEEKALKSNQMAADRGDEYGLLRMGERYRDGEGVDKDAGKARIYFQRAVAAGSTTASNELAQLPSP